MFNRGSHPRTYRQRIRQSGAIAITISCIPCICVVGSCVLISQAVLKIKAYERPSTALEHAKRRRTPRVLGPRLKGPLTIGKEDEDSDLPSGSMPGLGSKIVKHGEDVETGSEISSDKEKIIKSKVERKTDWQNQSGFFKLPLEIRCQIYEEAIGGYLIKTYYLEAQRRMSHTRWKAMCTFDCACRWQSTKLVDDDGWGNVSLLSLLCTCRRIYSESVEILYSKNRFRFESLTQVTNQLLNMPSHRIPLMRAVHWRMFTNVNIWSEATPWLDCRKSKEEEEGKEVIEGAGCVCWNCWPSQVWVDTHSHSWLHYCWLMRTVEDKKRAVASRVDNNFSRCFNEGASDLGTFA